MERGVVGLAAGMALGFAAYFGGFAAFLLVAALGAAGYLLGRAADGHPEGGMAGEWLRLLRPPGGGGDGTDGRGAPRKGRVR